MLAGFDDVGSKEETSPLHYITTGTWPQQYMTYYYNEVVNNK